MAHKIETYISVNEGRWVILNTLNIALDWITTYKKSETIKEAETHFGQPWKELERQGFRCVKVNIYYEPA